MTQAQNRFLRRVAGILGQTKNGYVDRINESNSDILEKGSKYQPITLEDVDSTVVHSEQFFKGSDILFDVEKFEKSELHDCLVWTHQNVKFNGVVGFEVKKWQMVGMIMTKDWVSPNGEMYYSGIYLKGTKYAFCFIKLEEFLSK